MSINADKENTFSTLCHEMCHYISHGNLYPEFYAMGGDNPDIVEGVTEYLTRNLKTPLIFSTPHLVPIRARFSTRTGSFAG